jgi:hypothetical protein
MIGKPEWFKYRVFGWGLAPKTWQGWAYVAVFAAAIGFVTAAGINMQAKPWLFGILLGILMLDVIHIMVQLPKKSDERDNYHQLIIERNCSFVAVGALLAVALYQAYQHRELIAAGFKGLPFDISIVIVLGAMVATKAISTFYVRMRM